MKMYKTLHLCDQHFGETDPRAIALSLQAIEVVKPDCIVLGGDLIDCYTISRFEKRSDQWHSLQEEINEAVQYLTECRRLAGRKCRMVLTLGNHEARMEKFIDRHAPGLGTLTDLKMSKLLQCDKLKIPVYDYGHGVTVGNVWFTHGSVVRKWAGSSARSAIEHAGRNLAMGHCHRMGGVKVRRGSQVYEAYESGCLCTLDPSYINWTPDWQQGLSLFVFYGRSGRRDSHLWVPVPFHQPNPLKPLELFRGSKF